MRWRPVRVPFSERMSVSKSGPRTLCLLVDYENVQPASIPCPNGGSVKALIFLGPNQTKVPLALAQSVQALGSDAQYVSIEVKGKNALDLCLAYWIGRLAAVDPKADFVIHSKDRGFDPLIAYLGKLGIRVRRRAKPLVAKTPAAASSDGIETELTEAVRTLRARRAPLPRRLEKLTNLLRAHFQGKLAEETLSRVVDELKARGTISMNGQEIVYHLGMVDPAKRSAASDAGEVPLPA